MDGILKFQFVLICVYSLDDITQPEEPKHEPALISNEFDILVEEHACDSENTSLKDATDGNVVCFESSQVNEQGIDYVFHL